MGASLNDELLLAPVRNLNSSQDLRCSKHVHDNVHGNIYLDPVTYFWISVIWKLISDVFGFLVKMFRFSELEFDFRSFVLFLQLSLKFIDTEQFQR